MTSAVLPPVVIAEPPSEISKPIIDAETCVAGPLELAIDLPTVSATVGFDVVVAPAVLDIPVFDCLDCFEQSVLKGLLSSIAKALADPCQWHMLGAGMKALEACIGVVRPNALLIVNCISSFESSITRVAAAELVEPNPIVEERRKIVESLGPVVEQHARSTANARESLQNNKTHHKGCLDRLAEIDVDIERLQAEKIVVSFEAARLESVVAQDQMAVTRLKSEGKAVRKQLEDLTTKLQHVPDPALVLFAAKLAMKVVRVAVIRLISGCLEKL